jgi:hypothetical protein
MKEAKGRPNPSFLFLREIRPSCPSSAALHCKDPAGRQVAATDLTTNGHDRARLHDRRRAPAVGSRAHVDLDPTEVLGGAGHWLHQGQERHPHRAACGSRCSQFPASFAA